MLEAAGLVTRRADPDQSRRVIYAPTAKALNLLPVLMELMRWNMKYNSRAAARNVLTNPGRPDSASRIQARLQRIQFGSTMGTGFSRSHSLVYSGRVLMAVAA